jgi:hypothetical protein
LAILVVIATAFCAVDTPSQAGAVTQVRAGSARPSAAVTHRVVSGRPCAAGVGVTVEVDFASTDRDHVVLGCAVGAQANGMAALSHAGFSTVEVPSVPGGAVCQIDGRPVRGYPYCWTTGGYWAYWRSNGSRRWASSQVGAGQTGRVPVGRVEGWRFTLFSEPFPSPAPSVPVAAVPSYVPTVSGRPCAPGAGVTEVVDFASTRKNKVVLGCAVGAQANGMAALSHAGFSTVEVPSVPGGAVCQIDGRPVRGYPYCWTTGGYWAYWRSNGSRRWASSQVGAGQTGRVAVGRVEGWRFTLFSEPFPSPAPSVPVAAIPSNGVRAPSTTSVHRFPRHDAIFGRSARIEVSVHSAVSTAGRVTVSVNGRRLARAKTHHGSALLVLPARSLRPGRHLLAIAYHGSTAVAPSRTRVLWTVHRAPARLEVTRNPIQVTTSALVTLTVTVRAAGLVPSGLVRVRRHGHLLRAARTHHSRVTMLMPRFGVPGTVRLRIVFGGSPTVQRRERGYGFMVGR